jgi:putative ABC transport system permease protein
MMRHLLRLVWNRKRTSALLILEIFCSFLVLFVVGTMGMYFWDNYSRPLGFKWDGVWSMSIDMKQATDDTYTPQQVERFARLLQEIRSLDGVEAAAGAMNGPFEFRMYQGGMEIDNRYIQTEFNEVTHELADVLGLEVVAGRWFQEGDEKLAWQPVVIDQDLAREAFGGEDAIGKKFMEAAPPGAEAPDRRVIGVVSDFRRAGELSGPGNYQFNLKRPGHPDDRPAQVLLIKVRPGMPATFEEQLIARAQTVVPDWSFEIKPLKQQRESSFRLRLMPLAVGGTVAFFLLLMVGLGLIGVLWQSLIQRTREIGLRRAAGASRAAVHRQVLMEQLLLTTLGVLLGSILVAQIPILDLIGLRGQVFAGGLLFAMASIYLLSLVCALYPGAMAARVQPAEALRYE